jgi:tyrosinase
MSAADRQAVINGLQQAKTSGAYDDLTELHQNAMLRNGNDWHRKPIFLPVHRWFILQLEAAIGVPMPYWDWVANRALPAGVGGNGSAAQGYRITTGPFRDWISRIFDTASGGFVDRPGILRQTATNAASLPTAAQMTRVMAQTVYDAAPWDQRSTTGFRNWVEGGFGLPKPAVHNRVHEWIGGDMRAGTSPNDPLFWFHHVNVDRIWAGWQNRRGVTNYAGPAEQGPDAPMPLTPGVTPSQMFSFRPYDRLP